ncbi:hypothetical protein H2200_002457 [Cladophialophora chaetospira]|uniref:Peptidase A1 domain-containing protein n=1 Tax=Cladophialophora chaetospira TaxID=386627 RepID=A0AA38XJV0_9EURO|nr:hypothetical protein H2200_002457 [Cladophialophora chaetospira]
MASPNRVRQSSLEVFKSKEVCPGSTFRIVIVLSVKPTATTHGFLYGAVGLRSFLLTWNLLITLFNLGTDNILRDAPKHCEDGNDGAWSSFAVQIGSPPQAVRLLPSITSNTIWTVWEYACQTSDLLDCPGSRGNVFNITGSSTWENQGNYSLPLNAEHYLPYSGGAVVGFDNITLDWQGYGGKSLDHQVVDAYVTTDFYIGSLGLSPEPINISTLNDPIPSLLGSLRQQNLIPSTSWGYLAGASYYSYPFTGYGSLTFGGYDASRLKSDANLTLAGGSDPYRPFLLGIESITVGGYDLLMYPIIAALDSLVSQLWLPISACQAFESAFGLEWNDEYELYTLNETQHSALVAKNSSITFQLSTGISNSTTRLYITLPYAAFDLKASPPLSGNETYFYFPLKRAANETQYILGRTFLQEAYMLADYDRGRITLYEAVYPEFTVQPKIITICSPNSTTCVGTSGAKPQSHKLGTGATVGIVIGAVAVLLLVGALTWYKCFRRKPEDQSKIETKTESASAPTSTSAYYGMSQKQELDGTALGSPRSELDGRSKAEMPDSAYDSGYTSSHRAQSSTAGFSPLGEQHGREVVSESGGREIRELSSQESVPSELYGSPTRYELPGSMS